MSDEIKQIAALIGHQQAQEKRVAALIDEFQKESALLGVSLDIENYCTVSLFFEQTYL
ncbi:TPA: hypothetical protein ACPZPF_004330 [Yersinia enterocolitica]|uniref:hypothetical protein n=1 Tax=Yersinia proxima TaxID=2890316 RepID=UPI002A4E1F90|nr:hypothetical protein [Yersinia proxima]